MLQSPDRVIATALRHAKQGGGPAAPLMPYGQFGPPVGRFAPSPGAPPPKAQAAVPRTASPAAPPVRRPHLGSPRNPKDLVGALRMFYERRNELRPDQQQRLMKMLGQDPDKPFAAKPELDWNEFQQKHDIPGSTHERFLYHQPYSGAERGGAVSPAIRIARELADGGEAPALPLTGKPGAPVPQGFHGPINSHVPGRTDNIKLDVKPGSYVWPADVVSIAGEGNSLAGGHVLSLNFPHLKFHAQPLHVGVGAGGLHAPHMHMPSPHPAPAQGAHAQASHHAARGGTHRPTPGNVPIIAAGGEVVTPPEAIIAKFGDLDFGHKTMDIIVKKMREREMERLRNAPPPKK